MARVLMIRIFSSPTDLCIFSAQRAALMWIFSSWQLVLYICGRAQAGGKSFGGRRTVRVWRGFRRGPFAHAADLVGARRSFRTHRSGPCSRAGSSGRRLGVGNPGRRPAAQVLSRLALGCRWRRRRRPAPDVDARLPFWPPHRASDCRQYSPVCDARAISRLRSGRLEGSSDCRIEPVSVMSSFCVAPSI